MHCFQPPAVKGVPAMALPGRKMLALVPDVALALVAPPPALLAVGHRTQRGLATLLPASALVTVDGSVDRTYRAAVIAVDVTTPVNAACLLLTGACAPADLGSSRVIASARVVDDDSINVTATLELPISHPTASVSAAVIAGSFAGSAAGERALASHWCSLLRALTVTQASEEDSVVAVAEWSLPFDKSPFAVMATLAHGNSAHIGGMAAMMTHQGGPLPRDLRRFLSYPRGRVHPQRADGSRFARLRGSPAKLRRRGGWRR